MAKLLTKKIKNKLEALFVPIFVYIILNFIYLTCKKRYHFDKSKVKNTPTIFVMWHGKIAMLAFGYYHYRDSKNVDVIVSQHHDGNIATKFLHLFGIGTLRGSSTRGGAQALKGAFKSFKNGKDVGITPDGPKGPRHSVANGAVVLAQKKNVPIVAIDYQASKAWRLKSWDKFLIPKPFSTLDYYFSDPFYVTDESLESAKQMIKERLMKHAF
ncbi:MAG: lysophospholipid acyltransferase family protein [Sulfurospirillum sp.]|nr:lysophospholipid acyltransferase family protein [Sulfurospirillum sp.]MBL0703383.1 lysophospholipid acyltransferase family protein [Sulfurospirillum sp.]